METISKFDGKYAFLSNFYTHEIMYDGLRYLSTEAAFQGNKTLDIEERKQFTRVTPSEAKKLGRKIKLRPDWDSVKDSVMMDVLRLKFKDPEMAKLLLSTGDINLVEGNYWHDNYWGNCTCEKCKSKTGKNTLGKMLMQIRDELKSA